MVIVGAAQIGKTDWLVITVLAAAYNGLNVLYVLPTLEQKNKYVVEKVKRPISKSDFYSSVVKDSETNSQKQIEFGKGLIRFVGGVSENEFKSYSADLVVIDETDEIDNEYNINQSFSRLRGSKHKLIRLVSNPKGKKGYITKKYELSDKSVRMCPCDKCGEFSELDWFKCVVKEITDVDGNVLSYALRDKDWQKNCGRDINLKCPIPGCDGNVNRHSRKSVWQPTQESKYNIVGYHMPSLCCPALNEVEELYYKFDQAIDSPSEMKTFYETCLGIPYDGSGLKVSDNVLNKCSENSEFKFQLEDNFAYLYHTWSNEEGSLFKSSDICAMGIDYATTHLDISISKKISDRQHMLLYVGKVDPKLGEYQVHELIERYNVEVCVMDMLPAQNFAQTLQENAICDFWLCKYLGAGSGRKAKFNDIDRTVVIDRTDCLDRSYSTLKVGGLLLPNNYQYLIEGNYAKEMQALSCVMLESAKGKIVRKWDGSNNDHARHSDGYRNLAAYLMRDEMCGTVSVYKG